MSILCISVLVRVVFLRRCKSISNGEYQSVAVSRADSLAYAMLI